MSSSPPKRPYSELAGQAEEYGYGEQAARPAPASPSPRRGRRDKRNLGWFDVPRYLQHYGYEFREREKHGQTYYALASGCLFDSSHGRWEAAIVQGPDPPYLYYHCFHNSCKGHTWKEARQIISGSDSIRQFFVGQDDGWRPPRPAKREDWQEGQVSPKASADAGSTAVAPSGPEVPAEVDPVPPPDEVDPWTFFEVKGKRTVFSENLMARYYLAHLQNIVCTAGVFWFYEGGLWRPYSRGRLSNICVRALKGEAKAARIDNTIKVLAGMINREEEEWPKMGKYVNCLNGMVNIETGELEPHDPVFGSRSQVPCRFDPDAPMDGWLKFLDEIFPGEPEKIDVLQEFFGYCLLADCRFERACFMFGTGANGKGTVLHVLRAMVGSENTCGLSMADLAQRFTVYRLQNKLVNIATETTARDPLATEIFKIVVSGEPLEAERKYGDKFEFVPYSKMLIAFNDLPVIPDKSYGFERRIILLNFNQRFSGDNRDPGKKEKLEAERDGVFFWALQGLGRLLTNGDFGVRGKVQEDGDRFMKALNPLLLYVEERCEVDSELRLEVSELYKDYQQWCKDGGNRPLARNRFGDQIQYNFPQVQKKAYGKNRRIHYLGIGFKSRLEG